MPGPARVVCISHTAGAGGQEVARAVAEELGFRYVDEDIVAEAAARQQVRPADIADVEKRRPLVSRLLDELGKVSVSGAFAGVVYYEQDDRAAYRDLIRDVIHVTAEAGRAVIVSHAASIALAERDDLLRVLVTASGATRGERMAAAGAADSVKEDDAARADYLKRFYGVDRELPTHYDLVLNTDRLDTGRAAALVVAAARG